MSPPVSGVPGWVNPSITGKYPASLPFPPARLEERGSSAFQIFNASALFGFFWRRYPFDNDGLHYDGV